jgi:hypothetical protein
MRRRTLLKVEELDGRVAPSAAAPTPPTDAGPTLAPPSSPTLYGNLHGQWKAEAPHPDVGNTSDLVGSGDLAGVGHVTLTGSVSAVGMIANGHAGGTLTLTGTNGSITLKLTGPSQPGFAALPDRFDYQVTGGTGKLHSLHSSGRIYLHLAADGSFTLAVRPSEPATIRSGVHGTVTIGPIAPVERPGVPNSKPLVGAIISLRRSASGAEVVRGTTDNNGVFNLVIDPGTYSVTVSPPGNGQEAHQFKGTVVIKLGQFTRLDVTIDSGIR